ncbi:MAG: hypothetical protein NTV22_07250, partial [bacterium]|nr:hypothetical protein [bacterium]
MSRHTPTPSHAAARAFDAALDACACAFSACLQHDAGARNTGAQQVAPDARVEFADGTWDCHCAVAPAHDPAAPDAPADAAAAFDLRISATLVAGIANGCGISACFAFDTWSPDNYVLLPGAAYNGNRFAARPLPYPPILQPADVGVDVPTIITDVPRLNDAAGPSRIQQLTRDVATPALAVYVPALAVAVFFFTDVRTRAGDRG